MDDARTGIIVDIAKRFIALLQQLEPKWKKGYLRFRLDPAQYGSNASYENEAKVLLIDTMRNRQFFGIFNEKGVELMKDLGKPQGVFLLVVDSTFKYNYHFEYEDLDRWKISKLEGATGVLVGIPGSFDQLESSARH